METKIKKFYLFTEKGITDTFYCGNIYEEMPDDEIRYHGCPMTFQDCVNEELCKEFDTRKQANDYSRMQEEQMQDSNDYANRAMECEEYYGCEGVDDMRYEN